MTDTEILRHGHAHSFPSRPLSCAPMVSSRAHSCADETPVVKNHVRLGTTKMVKISGKKKHGDMNTLKMVKHPLMIQ